MIKGTIFDIQRNSFVDGPGIRTSVFFKGCNLRCAWCHNPESQSFQPETLFYQKKCIGCGVCREPPHLCPNGAKVPCGRPYTTQEVLAEVCRDKLFYDTSGGGLTCSGGECMLQIDFLEELLQQAKAQGISTAVDTAGAVPWANFARILPYTDLFLYDIKLVDPQAHKRWVGLDNRLVLENLKKLLEAGARVWIRQPVIPGVNDSPEEQKRLQTLLAGLPPVEKLEYLPYHSLGDHKYEALGLTPPSFPQNPS